VTGDLGQQLELARQRIQRLQAVVAASERVNSTLDTKELADYIVDIATDLVGAERGSLFLVDRDAGTLRSLVAQGIAHDQVLRLKVGEGIVGAVAASGAPDIINDPYADPRFDASVDRATGFTTRSLLTVPVKDREGQTVAVLQLLNNRHHGFSSDDVAFLGELGVSFAIALNSARLHREIVERERSAEELRLAGEIQHTLLPPRRRLEVPGLEIETLFRPSREVGGDFFDLIPSASDQRWWLTMADISGKGVSAGIIASNVQAVLWSRRDDDRGLAETLASSNDILYRLTRGRKFATMTLTEWDPETRTLGWVNAGHPPILIAHGQEVTQLEASGRPVGLLPNQTYVSGTVRLAAGDLFLLYTDGVMEAGVGCEQGEFGVERIAGCMPGATSAGELLRRLVAELEAHLDEEPPDDDLTVLCARCTE
jgi:serine phosphatase RsbU (regulator of sigma subunit)